MAITLKAPLGPLVLDYGESLGPGARAPASYAASAIASRGRRFGEPECATRSPFQRDRDRVLHSTAFRRLTYKTQVFLYHEGDHYRTRLTHSLEVAQIARTIARQLRLDEDLAEALALAHDLGHSPFGHAGERALEAAMAQWGGFDHNAQSLRVVTGLERKYLGFDGLNPTWETLEGLVKHNGPIAEGGGSAVAKVARNIERWQSLEMERWPSAEAQVAALADDIAYINHDIDDGLRAGLIGLDDLRKVALAGEAVERLVAAAPGVWQEAVPREPAPRDPAPQESMLQVSPGDAAARPLSRMIYEVTRQDITAMIRDVVAQSRERLRSLAPESPDDIRGAAAPVVVFSPGMARDLAAAKAFLFERVYRHERVMRVMRQAEAIVVELFQRYMSDPDALPASWREAAKRMPDDRRRARLVADFVAGQTDRFAIAEHRRLFDATPELR